jgi:hypothetical protein
MNKTIVALTEEFHIHHQNSTPYRPQENATVEDFNKILENILTNIFNVGRVDWDLIVPELLLTYMNTSNKLTCQTPFKLVYNKEVVITMEFILPISRIAEIT